MNKMIFILLLLSLAFAAYGQQERVAIIQTLDDRDSIGISDLAYLTDRLRETAVKVLPKSHYGVMTTESIVAFLGSEERAIKACKEASCLAELGRKVNADYVAQAHIGRFGNDLTIKVELYNSKSGNLMDSFTGNSKDIYGLLAFIDEKAPALFKNMPDVTASPPTPEYTPPAPQYAPSIKFVDTDTALAYEVHKLIYDDLKKNKEKIQENSFYLSLSHKTTLYERNRKKYAIAWAVLNVLPGGGLGSIIQGDIVFGSVQLVFVGVAYAFYVHGNNVLYSCTGESGAYGPECRDAHSVKSKWYIAGWGVLGANYIMGLIVPFVHQSKYNKALKEALNIDDNISYSIAPLIIPRNGTPAVGLAFNLQY